MQSALVRVHVHVRGYRTADLCHFVEDTNLARGRQEFTPLAKPNLDWYLAVVKKGAMFPIEKRQTKWSEYLDNRREQVMVVVA